MVKIKSASELMNQFFQDIEYVLKPALSNVYPTEYSEAKNRISDFISNYGDSLFMVDVEEVSGRTIFLRRGLFEIMKETDAQNKSRIFVSLNTLDKRNIIATVNEKNDQRPSIGDFEQKADTQFIIGLHSLVSQVYDRFCTKEGEQ